MLTPILIPLDGSALAARALPFAAHLSRITQTRLILIRAHLPNGDSLSMRLRYPDESAVERASLERGLAQAELVDTTDTLRRAGLHVEPHFVEGPPATAILRTAAASGAGMIVMSTHGHGGFGRWLYGSVTDEILRHADVPVLVVSAAVSGSWSENQATRVLVSLDRSGLSHEILGPAVQLATSLNAEIVLVSVVEPPVVMSVYGEIIVPPNPETELAETEAYLEGVAAQLRTMTGQPVAVRAAYGAAAATICDLARDVHASAIAMATHGRGGLARFVLGSAATGTLQQSSVPVFMYRPAAVRQDGAERPPVMAGAALSSR
jgi:nucleotide-binding universal stress UspA family protein